MNAMVRLQEKGLYARVQLRHSSTLSKGMVIEQRPRAGAVVKAG
ncbi:MAG: PASTA domain-containing protein, partial [Candidatus Aminicenantes bacterium]|nr:PASTA domain-containing protein [Candidatus Aminicenantes bacterium]